MRATWAMLAAFLAVGLFAAGCGGGGGSDTGYDEEGETGSGTATTGTGDPAAGTGTPPDENPNPEGWAKRITKGSGQESLGTEEMTQAEYKDMEQIGKDITRAEVLYKQYMEKKEKDGTQDEGTKNSALSLYDSILQRLNALMEKYPNSPTLQQYHNTASYNHHALAWE